jgi:hypothetical protein
MRSAALLTKQLVPIAEPHTGTTQVIAGALVRVSHKTLSMKVLTVGAPSRALLPGRWVSGM